MRVGSPEMQGLASAVGVRPFALRFLGTLPAGERAAQHIQKHQRHLCMVLSVEAGSWSTKGATSKLTAHIRTARLVAAAMFGDFDSLV